MYLHIFPYSSIKFTFKNKIIAFFLQNKKTRVVYCV